MLSSATIWMIFLCIWMYLGTTASGVKLVGIRPSRIFTEANRPLEVSCTLNDMVDHNLTSEALSFRWKHGREKIPIPKVYVQTPNTSTAMLLLPQVGRDRDRFLLSCYVGDSDDSIFVRVGFKPKPSVDLDVIADNWEIITINWTKEKNPSFRTTTDAYWKMGRDEKPFKRCQNRESMSFDDIQKYQCWVEISNMDLDLSTYFTVKVNSSNSIGNTTTQDEIFFLHDINKPAKINFMTLRKVETTWVKVGWESPAHGRSLAYKFSATCLQSTQVFDVDATVERDVSLNVTGLIPGTQCMLSIAARSSHAAIWSDPYTLNITTKESVPLGLPLTTRGAFDITTSGNIQYITLYWQPVPAHLKGGRITHYNVIHWSREDSGRKSETREADKCRRRILNEYPNRESYLSVMASTSVGYNQSIQLRAQVIVLPETLVETQKPENVSALINTNNVTEVRWVGHAEGEYTGYWCASDGKTCLSTISWTKHISSPWKVPLSSQMDHRRYRFGISLDLDTASSGISWSDCVYQMKAKSGPPTVENKTTTGSIKLRLKHSARCSVDAGFIYAYQITYCRTDGSKCDGPVKNLTVSRTGKTTAVEIYGLQENTKYYISVYSITAAGASLSPVTHVLTTMAGVKTEIVSRLAIYLCVGSVLLVLLCVGIYCVCTKCREKCGKTIRKLHIPIKLPNENTQKEINSDEMTIGYAVPYHNLKRGSTSPEERAQDMIGSYSNVEKPPLPPRMESLPRSDNDSGISFTSEVPTHPPPASSPVKKGQLPQLVSITKGGSTEDILDQNQKNIMKDEDYDYNYAPTVSLDETVNGTSKPASLSESTSSSGDESDHYKEAAILLKNVNPHSASNPSKASDEEDPDFSGSSYGYKPVLMHDLGKSNTPLLSRNSLPPQPVNSHFSWEHVKPSNSVIVNEPVSLLDPAIVLPMSADVGDHIDSYSVEDNNLEDNDSDYGYAPNPLPGLVIGTPDNAWYHE